VLAAAQPTMRITLPRQKAGPVAGAAHSPAAATGRSVPQGTAADRGVGERPAELAVGETVEQRLRRAERLGHNLADFPVTARPAHPVQAELTELPARAALPARPDPAAAAPAWYGSAPIQGVFGWKKKLGTALGVIGGAAGLAVGATIGPSLLALGGGLTLGASLAYGGTQIYQQRQERRRREESQRRLKNLREADPLEGQEFRGEANIPNDMHFIWLGGQLPEARRDNILNWQKSAKGVTPHLWVDSNSAAASARDLEGLRKAGVRVRDVGELDKRSDRFAKARDQLPTADGKGVNGGAAAAVSDLARLEILRHEGGHYMDSDNTPGPQAHRFADMRSETGLRLGFSPIEVGNSPTFSNDAMSAAPGNEFVESYLDESYGRLNEQSAAKITSRDPDKVKTSVMSTTGPEAMAAVPLPVSKAEVASVADELKADYPDTDRVDVRTFPRSRAMKEDIGYHPTVRTLLERFGYGRGLFHRGLGNSWVPRGKEQGEEKKKDK
jgi:hypothetical protein